MESAGSFCFRYGARVQYSDADTEFWNFSFTFSSPSLVLFHTILTSLSPPLSSVLSLLADHLWLVLSLPSLSLSPLPYFSICLILARPLTHKSNTGHLNTICLLPMESRLGRREQRGGSMAPLTVSPLTRFHIHLPIASSSLLPLSFFLFSSKPSGVVTG